MSTNVVAFPSRRIALQRDYVSAVVTLRDAACDKWAEFLVTHYPERVANGVTEERRLEAWLYAADMLQMAAEDLRDRVLARAQRA